MGKKKIVYIIALVVLIVGIITFFVVINQKGKQEVAQTQEQERLAPTEETKQTTTSAQESLTSDSGESEQNQLPEQQTDNDKADIVIGDKYFDTQIADINTNFKEYEGKTIEIEGLYFQNGPYTFVGRYSTSNLCPNCPAGVSYLEYEWESDKKPTLTQEDSWLKVRGELKKGIDQGQEYYYIQVADLQVMPEKGLTTVNN